MLVLIGVYRRYNRSVRDINFCSRYTRWKRLVHDARKLLTELAPFNGLDAGCIFYRGIKLRARSQKKVYSVGKFWRRRVHWYTWEDLTTPSSILLQNEHRWKLWGLRFAAYQIGQVGINNLMEELGSRRDRSGRNCKGRNIFVRNYEKKPERRISFKPKTFRGSGYSYWRRVSMQWSSFWRKRKSCITFGDTSIFQNKLLRLS